MKSTTPERSGRVCSDSPSIAIPADKLNGLGTMILEQRNP